MPDPAQELVVWERETGVACVVCPECAFTFDAVHETWPVGGKYSCPACAEIRLREAAGLTVERLRGAAQAALQDANLKNYNLFEDWAEQLEAAFNDQPTGTEGD